MSDYLSHIVEQSRGVTPGVQPLIAPMFAPPSFSAFISLEDLVQQQTPDSASEETPEALLTPPLALPDILAAQSSHVPIEPVEPQPRRVEEILSHPRLKAETQSEQPSTQTLHPESAPSPRAVHLPVPLRKELPASDDLPSPQASLPAQPRTEENFFTPAFLPGEPPSEHVQSSIVPVQPLIALDQPAILLGVKADFTILEEEPASGVARGEFSGLSPDSPPPFAFERGVPKNLDLMRFEKLIGISHPTDEAPVGTLSGGQVTDGSRPSPIMDVHTLSGISHPTDEAPVGADLSRPSPIYRPAPGPSEGNAPKTLHLRVGHIPSPLLPGEISRPADQSRAENGRYVAGSAAGEPAPSAVQGERDELLSPRDSRRPSPAYQHDSNLAPEPGAQQRSLTRPRVDDAHRSESVIRVSIGRVEVRATALPAAPIMKRAAPAAPALSLNDYLKRQKGGTR